MVEDPRIHKKKINARHFFQTIAEIQFESGYPYIMFEDTVNRATPVKTGWINMSNLCSEIMRIAQYRDDHGFPGLRQDRGDCRAWTDLRLG